MLAVVEVEVQRVVAEVVPDVNILPVPISTKMPLGQLLSLEHRRRAVLDMVRNDTEWPLA